MKNQKIIILTTIITLTSAMLFLAWTEKNQRDNNQDFWSVYFVAPLTNTDNRFVIDNKTHDNKTFHYTISTNNEKKYENDIKIQKNTRKLIDTKNFDNKNVQITITSDNDEKTLEKK